MTAVGGSPPTRRCPATEDRAPATVATPSSTDPTASRAVSWWSVHEYVAPTLAAAVEWPMAGTPAWCDLDDTDPVKWARDLRRCSALGTPGGDVPGRVGRGIT